MAQPSSSQKIYSLCFESCTHSQCRLYQRNWKTITTPLHMRPCQSLFQNFVCFKRLLTFTILNCKCNGNSFLKEDPNKWNFVSQPTLCNSKGEDINSTASMMKKALQGMLMRHFHALIHLHFCVHNKMSMLWTSCSL